MLKSDLELLNNTKLLVKKEKEYTVLILKNLIQIEQKKLFVELGFSSLHSYCVEILGYAPSEAYLKLSAMKLMKEFSFIEENLEKGKLSLTAVGELQISIAKKEKEEGLRISKETKSKLLSDIEFKSTREAQKIVKAKLKIEDKIKPSDFKFKEETIKMLKKLGEKMDVQDLDLLMQMLVKEKADRLIDEKKTQTPSALKEPSTIKITRNIPLSIKRKVYIRANYQCEKCKSKKYLNIDHVWPFAKGGKHSLDNMRILCSACNQRERVKIFGEKIKQFRVNS
ncbi:MAG: HNH endonuclease signature motif containing protein [Bacteriovoracaceae bacterium]